MASKIHKLISDRLSELLEKELGSYQVGSEEKPTIFIVPPQVDGNIIVKKKGVEIVISKSPEPVALEVFAGGVEYYYHVLLIQRDIKASLTNAIDLMMQAFDNPKIRTRKLQEQDKTKGLRLEQVLFILPQDRDWESQQQIDYLAAVRNEFYK